MFAKLLKYEWRASRKLLGILSLAALGVGVIGAFVVRYLVAGLEPSMYGSDSEMLSAVLVIILVFLFFALLAYMLGSELFLLYRFYKNKFTDEGYLTFTLPVNSRQIFLSSFLNMAVWMVIVGIVIVAAVLITVLGGVLSTGYGDLLYDIGEFYGDVTWFGDQLGLSLLSGATTFVYNLVMAMTSVTIGAVLAKKHKLLTAFGIYYIISALNSIFQTVLSVTVTLTETAEMTGYYLGQIGIQLVLIVGGFFLSTYLMEKKLNLP